MLILSETDVKKCLDIKACLAANRKALRVIATGEGALIPTRIGIHYKDDDWSLFKPATLPPLNLGVKVVSTRANNPSIGLPQVPATILHMNRETGMVEAVLGGTYLTAARTASGSALAIQYHCARLNHLVIFGAGLQAQLHIDTIQAAMDLDTIPMLTVINRSSESAEKFIKTNLHRCAEVEVVLLSDTSRVISAVERADAICACTSSKEALWPGTAQLKENCVMTAVGSYIPDRREIPLEAIESCDLVYADTIDAKEAGDLKDVNEDKIDIKIFGNILSAEPNPCPSPGRVFFKSVGSAIQDVLTTDIVVEEARRKKIGQIVDMS